MWNIFQSIQKIKKRFFLTKRSSKLYARANADLGALVSEVFYEICVVKSLPEQTATIILCKITANYNVVNRYSFYIYIYLWGFRCYNVLTILMPSIALKFEKFKYINYLENMWHYQYILRSRVFDLINCHDPHDRSVILHIDGT